MGIKEILKGKLGFVVEHDEVVEEKIIREQGYQIEAVCDTEEEIKASIGNGIGIGGADDD